jgi:FixJ family two-component response regulator
LICQSAEKLLASEFPAGARCLLLDVWMPGMNGIELCRSLAAAGRELPTILMSGLDDERTSRIMRRAEPMACLFKPFEERQLIRAIRKALSKRLDLIH